MQPLPESQNKVSDKEYSRLDMLAKLLYLSDVENPALSSDPRIEDIKKDLKSPLSLECFDLLIGNTKPEKASQAAKDFIAPIVVSIHHDGLTAILQPSQSPPGPSSAATEFYRGRDRAEREQLHNAGKRREPWVRSLAAEELERYFISQIADIAYRANGQLSRADNTKIAALQDKLSPFGLECVDILTGQKKPKDASQKAQEYVAETIGWRHKCSRYEAEDSERLHAEFGISTPTLSFTLKQVDERTPWVESVTGRIAA